VARGEEKHFKGKAVFEMSGGEKTFQRRGTTQITS
jgi:hypothetical protein